MNRSVFVSVVAVTALFAFWAGSPAVAAEWGSVKGRFVAEERRPRAARRRRRPILHRPEAGR